MYGLIAAANFVWITVVHAAPSDVHCFDRGHTAISLLNFWLDTQLASAWSDVSALHGREGHVPISLNLDRLS